MDMLPFKYIKVSYFLSKSAKKSFCVWRMSKKLKKIEKNFEKILKFFFTKPILSIIYELCQHLGSLRSLLKAPETKTLGAEGGGTECPPPLQSRVKDHIKVYSIMSCHNIKNHMVGLILLLKMFKCPQWRTLHICQFWNDVINVPYILLLMVKTVHPLTMQLGLVISTHAVG